MTFEEYQNNVQRTMNYNDPQELHNYLLGLAGAVGELLNYLKKHLHHGHELNLIHAQEEIGDCLWHLGALCNVMGLPMDDVAYYNIMKLQKRCPKGFSHLASIERKDIND